MDAWSQGRSALLAGSTLHAQFWFWLGTGRQHFCFRSRYSVTSYGMQTILMSSKQTYDIRSPSTFLLASHPDFGTGLQLIVLPIGFVLLGVVKEETNNHRRRYGYILVVTAAIILGVFSHDEIYFFIIIASLLPVIFKLPHKNSIYICLLLAIGIALFAHYFFYEEYLGYTAVLGIPLIYNLLLFCINLVGVISH